MKKIYGKLLIHYMPHGGHSKTVGIVFASRTEMSNHSKKSLLILAAQVSINR